MVLEACFHNLVCLVEGNRVTASHREGRSIPGEKLLLCLVFSFLMCVGVAYVPGVYVPSLS